MYVIVDPIPSLGSEIVVRTTAFAFKNFDIIPAAPPLNLAKSSFALFNTSTALSCSSLIPSTYSSIWISSTSISFAALSNLNSSTWWINSFKLDGICASL